MINFESEQEAIDLLKTHGIEISAEWDILYSRGKEFNKEVHEAVEYLIDEWDFDIKFI